MGSPRFQAPRTVGFTLIELMVVISLIAILSAVIIPEMRGSFKDAVLRGASRKFIDVFGLANGRAVALHQIHRVRLDRLKGQFVLERSSTRGGRTAMFVPVREISGGEGTLNPHVTFELRPTVSGPTAPAASEPAVRRSEPSGGRALEAVTFYPDGTADAAELVLRDDAGFRLSLKLNPVTARVRVTVPDRP